MKKIILFTIVSLAILICKVDAKKKTGVKYKVNKTEVEWKKILSDFQYHVLREKGTERAFSGEYNDFHKNGKYLCAACGQLLFSSETKFKSHSGWPSFYDEIKKGAIDKITDDSLGMSRVEIVCSRCGSHIGHVFDDGPKPTGLRYCTNSVSLKFKE